MTEIAGAVAVIVSANGAVKRVTGKAPVSAIVASKPKVDPEKEESRVQAK